MSKIQPLARCSAISYEAMDMNRSTSSLSSNSPSLIFLTRRSLPSAKHTRIFFPQRHRSIRSNPITIFCSSSSDSNDGNGGPESVQPPTVTPPGAVEVRFRRRSRRQSRQKRDDNGTASSSSVQSTKAKVSESHPNKWEDMSLAEKAVEVYMGEKGLLFWLNKFAYASIFIVIGAWIVFRFVGPAFNLYQLDSPPLSPSSIFKGSS